MSPIELRATKLPHNRHTGTPRVTTYGCECEKYWTADGYENDPTKNYCANPDNNPVGEWCIVTEEDEICQGTDWGFCAAEGAGTPGGFVAPVYIN